MLSKVETILLIGFTSMTFLLALNLYKVYQLKKENTVLKNKIDDKS